MEQYKTNKSRLADLILEALELSLDQDDLEISEVLNKALDLSMTRKTGGGEFIERRDYPQVIEDALDRLKALQEQEQKKAAKG